MFDPKLYREACRELTAPEDKLEEIIAMTENTNKKRTRRPLRTALIAAAAVAMMVVSVAAANPELPGEIWYRVLDIVQVGQYRSEVLTEDGETMTLLNVPETWVEDRDGRAILVVAGEDAADITEALANEGRYVYEDADEGAHLVITVTGSIDNWELSAGISTDEKDPGMVYAINSTDLEKEKEKAADDNVGTYIIEDDDLDGDVAIGFTTTHEFPHQ